MQAAAFMDFGGPDMVRIMDVKAPEPEAGEIVVAVAASPVNPTDTLMRAGRQAAMMQHVRPPYVTGVEFSGHVCGDGAGRSSFAVGAAVMGLVDARRHGGGSHAEYVRVRTSSLVEIPPSMDIVAASTVPMNGVTAVLALEAVELQRGATLLVTGGTGAVGGYVLQLARRTGLRVIADARDAEIDRVRALGASIVIARGESMEREFLKHCPNGADGLIDCALLADRAASLVRDGGTVVSLRKSHAINDPRLRARVVSVFDVADHAPALQLLAACMRDGRLAPHAACQMPLDEAAEAHRRVERGALPERMVLMPRPR